MQTLALSMRASQERGAPLPVRYKGLGALGAHFRRGQVSLIVAAAGVGKSSFIMDYSIFADYDGEGNMIPTLYFSADSDEQTIGDRATAAIIGKDTTEAHKLLRAKDNKTWRAQEEATNHIWFNFEPTPTLDDISDEIDAYCYYTGDFPHLIVIDTAMNVQAGGDMSMGMQNLYGVMDAAHKVARLTGAHVCIQHHATGEHVDGNQPLPRSGIMGKIDKLPRLILTLYKPGPDLLGVSVVKNSNGPADANGVDVQVQLPFMPSRSWIGGTV